MPDRKNTRLFKFELSYLCTHSWVGYKTQNVRSIINTESHWWEQSKSPISLLTTWHKHDPGPYGSHVSPDSLHHTVCIPEHLNSLKRGFWTKIWTCAITNTLFSAIFWCTKYRKRYYLRCCSFAFSCQRTTCSKVRNLSQTFTMTARCSTVLSAKRFQTIIWYDHFPKKIPSYINADQTPKLNGTKPYWLI